MRINSCTEDRGYKAISKSFFGKHINYNRNGEAIAGVIIVSMEKFARHAPLKSAYARKNIKRSPVAQMADYCTVL